MFIKKAFTLIEVLVSIIIISGAILYVLKVHTKTREEIEYISNINKNILQDTFFEKRKILKYNKDKKTAYDMIEDNFIIENSKSLEILKNIKRDIIIPDTKIIKEDNIIFSLPTIKFQEIILKDKYSSYYFHFSMSL